MVNSKQMIVVAWKNREAGSLVFVKEDEQTGRFDSTENVFLATDYENLSNAKDAIESEVFPNAYDIYDVTVHASFRKVPDDEE